MRRGLNSELHCARSTHYKDIAKITMQQEKECAVLLRQGVAGDGEGRRQGRSLGSHRQAEGAALSAPRGPFGCAIFAK